MSNRRSIDVWHPEFGCPDDELNRARGIEESLTNLENKLIDLRNQRDAVNLILWDKVKRVRADFKASYGDDSSQFEMVDGTRVSDRKTARGTAVLDE